MYSRLLKVPDNKSLFLFGPRGTGKSHWVKTRFPNSVYIDLLESQIFNSLLANPTRLENLIAPKFNGQIIIDEVQKIPELLDEVHRLIENKKYKFILTGSSARKLKQKGVNLLAGRALTYFMHPLTLQEVKSDFNLKTALNFGMLPSVFQEENPKKYLESYVRTYLQEEVQQEGLTRNLAAFSRFLEAASFSQGGVLSISEIARECAVERKVVENYFTILEDLLLAYRLPVFSKKAKRRLVQHPKFYFFDVGVYRTLRPKGPLDSSADVDGPALETLFYQQARALNDACDLGYQIYYWRTSNEVEVDFVLYGEKGLACFEIKRSQKFTNKDLNGLRSFLEDYPMAKAYFLYGGSVTEYHGKITVMPFSKCLENLAQIL